MADPFISNAVNANVADDDREKLGTKLVYESDKQKERFNGKRIPSDKYHVRDLVLLRRTNFAKS